MGVPLNQHQWPRGEGMAYRNQEGHDRDMLDRARSSSDFRGQMNLYRLHNGEHPGVDMYLQRQRDGYWAHTDALYHQARSIDSPSSVPLGHAEPLWSTPGGDSTTLGQVKAEDFETNYNPEYKANMRRAITEGNVDPVHVAEGVHMQRDQNYGLSVGRTTASGEAHKNDVWLGNGNHRVSIAHALGVQFIPARNSSHGSGDEEGYGGSQRFGNKHKSWADENPEAI